MGEKIFDFIKGLATGKYSKAFWGTIILLIVFLILIFPYIDANFLYYTRIEKRIDNLNSLVEISGKTVYETPSLLSEYNSIIEEIKNAQDKNINSVLKESNNGTFDYWVKFISGGFMFALVGIIGLFQIKKGIKYSFSFFLKNNFTVFAVCGIIAVILAYLFSQIPTLGNVWVNAIASPVIQIIVMYLLFLKPKQ